MINVDDVILDAKKCSLSKNGASRNDIQIFYCKYKECPFLKKHVRKSTNSPYFIHTSGLHHHWNAFASSNRRGLDEKRKHIIDEAF